MWQYHAHTQRIHNAQLLHQRCEIVAIGTQAMQPDDRSRSRTRRMDLNGVEQRFVHADQSTCLQPEKGLN